MRSGWWLAPTFLIGLPFWFFAGYGAYKFFGG